MQDQDKTQRIQAIIERAFQERETALKSTSDLRYAHISGYLSAALDEIYVLIKEG